jgi:uncharacterized coiled-coil protein SlyX
MRPDIPNQADDRIARAEERIAAAEKRIAALEAQLTIKDEALQSKDKLLQAQNQALQGERVVLLLHCPLQHLDHPDTALSFTTPRPSRYCLPKST